jgi:hypothetical protein
MAARGCLFRKKAKQGEHEMKSIIPGLAVAMFVLLFAGCDQAQKAIDTIDKAKAIKDSVEKTAREVTDKARELVPGNGRGEGSGSEGQKEGRGEKERGEGHGEKDDD